MSTPDEWGIAEWFGLAALLVLAHLAIIGAASWLHGRRRDK